MQVGEGILFDNFLLLSVFLRNDRTLKKGIFRTEMAQSINNGLPTSLTFEGHFQRFGYNILLESHRTYFLIQFRPVFFL